MRARAISAVALAATALSVGAAAAETPTPAAESPTRDEYAARVEPICRENTLASDRILAGSRERIRRGELPRAGGQLLRAARAFGRTTSQLAAVPRPPADGRQISRWIEQLRMVERHLRMTGRALRKQNRARASLGEVKLRRSALATNNVVYNFPFRYCRLDESRFT